MQLLRCAILAGGDQDFVERGEISLGAGDDDIGVGAVAAKGARLADFGLGVHGLAASSRAVRFDAHGHFANGVDAFGDGVDDKFQQRAPGPATIAIDGLVGRIDRAGADRGLDVQLAIRAAQAHGGGGHAHRAADHLQAVQRVDLARLVDGVGEERLQVGVGDGLFLVGQRLEALEQAVDFVFIQVVAQVLSCAS